MHAKDIQLHLRLLVGRIQFRDRTEGGGPGRADGVRVVAVEQLEAVYRFLIDPKPYQSITTATCPGTMEPCAIPQGIDQTLLAQRAAFLRDDSAVAIVNITDENDCSTVEGGLA